MVDKIRLEGKAIITRSLCENVRIALQGDLTKGKVDTAYEWLLQLQEELVRLKIEFDN